MGTEYLNSYIFYVVILIIITILAKLAECSQSVSRRRIFIIAIIMLLSLIAGIRGYDIGRDTSIYYSSTYQRIVDGRFNAAHGGILYSAIFYLISSIGGNYSCILFIVALVSYSLIIVRLWELGKYSYFSLMIFAFYCLWFPVSLNVTRQFLSIAMVFFATRFLESDKKLLFCLYVILAMFIHSISILGFGLLIINCLNNKHNRKNFTLNFSTYKRNKIFLIAILIGVFLLYMFFPAEHYIMLMEKQARLKLGVMQPLKISIFLTLYYIIRKDNLNKKNILIYSLFGLLLSCLDYFFENASRVAWYFLLFEIVGYSFKNRSNKFQNMLVIVLSLLYLYTFGRELYINGNQILPYCTFWGSKL